MTPSDGRRRAPVGPWAGRFLLVFALLAGMSRADARTPGSTKTEDLEALITYCYPHRDSLSDAEVQGRRKECLDLMRQHGDVFLGKAKRLITANNVSMAFLAGDEPFFDLASRVCELFVLANVGRDWVREVVIDAIALVSRESRWPYAAPIGADPDAPVHRTEAEWEKIRDLERRVQLVERFALWAIDAFGHTGDRRLADELVGMLGYSRDIDDATLTYLNASCAGNRALAERVRDAVFAIPWKERFSLTWESALRLISASEDPTRYLSPVQRIRRLWYAPFTESDRSATGRGLVEDEARELEVVLRFPEHHIAAMAELFDDMTWDAPNYSELNSFQSLARRGMLAMLQQMPIAKTRGLLAEWYARIAEAAPLLGDSGFLSHEIILHLKYDCVPQLAAWMPGHLPEAERRGRHGYEEEAERAIQRAVRYLAMCQATMPETREWAARLAKDHPGTIRSWVLRAFGPDILPGQEPGTPPKE